MKNKPKDNKRGNKAIKISESINDITNKAISKFGKIEFILYTKWDEMVGDHFAEFTEPNKIDIIKNEKYHKNSDDYEGILKVNIIGAASLDFQHFSDKIIEKINSFFGYKAITKIKLNHVPYLEKVYKKTTSLKNIKLSESNKNIIKDTTSVIKNKSLERSLNKLGKSILKETINEKNNK